MLHALVREHLTAFIRDADERYTRPLPRYVKRAFEQYLRCGLPEHGFLRLRCDDCGHDRVVAFSCKERGTCPSCAGRTMTNTAAHLVDRVLPNVPIRQWVLSLPFELRALAARRPEVVCAIDRILFREVEQHLQRSHGPRDGRAGALTFVQRFGGSLNLHVHFHVLVLEGVFTRDGGAAPVFHPSLAPTRAELLAVLARVARSVHRWLERRGLNKTRDEEGTGASESDALDACANVAVQAGLFDKLEGEAPLRGRDDHTEPAGFGRHSIALEGFNLHAAVNVGADDDVSRERLLRYCARPPFALDRLSLLPDGRIAYRIKQPRRNGTHRILEPIELLARIAALIPPPRHPFLRYHGVLAPSAKWRSLIVPRANDAPTRAAKSHSTTHDERARVGEHAVARKHTHGSERRPAVRVRTAAPPNPSPPPPATAPADRASYARITAAHLTRLDAGDLLARTPRLEWSKLLRRTFLADVLVCPRCTGRARVIAAVHDRSEAVRVLNALDERSIPTPLASARDPDDLQQPTVVADVDELDLAPLSGDGEQPPGSSELEPPPPDD